MITEKRKPRAANPGEEMMVAKPRVVSLDAGKTGIESLLSYRLSVVSNLLSRSQLVQFESVAPISQPEWRMLVLVNSYGPLSVKALSRRAGLDFGQTSRLVSRMCESGLVAKERSDDARSVNLSLTTEGRALHRRLWTVAMKCNDLFLKSLNVAERKALTSALDTLTHKARASLDARRRSSASAKSA
jgi:DNA-binding MarR family transcriptional regulator